MSYVASKPFTAARFCAGFGRTQMVDWLTACGVHASRDNSNGGEGPLRVQTGHGLQEVPFGWWVIPAAGLAVMVPAAAFEALFVEGSEGAVDLPEAWAAWVYPEPVAGADYDRLGQLQAQIEACARADSERTR